jgi:hypothetical protein
MRVMRLRGRQSCLIWLPTAGFTIQTYSIRQQFESVKFVQWRQGGGTFGLVTIHRHS